MIAEGTWPREMKYISCDDYDGKNTPARTGLDLKKAISKGFSEPPTFGPFKITKNGDSSMQFNMQLFAVGVRDSASDKSINLGLWKAGFNNNLTLTDPKGMKGYTADKVYRVVTVEVSDQHSF